MTRFFNRFSDRNKRKILREQRPEAERILWAYLKNKQLGYKFRRQFSIGKYVVDFYCSEKRLIIEIDGDSHFTDEAETYDNIREDYLKDLQLRILRFTNIEVRKQTVSVVERIRETLSVNDPSVSPEGSTAPLH